MISTVIFDLDDTPYDEIDFCRGGFRAAALHIAALSDAHSIKAVLDTLCKCFITGDCGSTFDLALAELGIACDGPSYTSWWRSTWRTTRPRVLSPLTASAF